MFARLPGGYSLYLFHKKVAKECEEMFGQRGYEHAISPRWLIQSGMIPIKFWNKESKLC